MPELANCILDDYKSPGYKLQYRQLCERLSEQANLSFLTFDDIAAASGLSDQRLWKLSARVRNGCHEAYLDKWVKRYHARGYDQERIRELTKSSHRELRSSYKRVGLSFTFHGVDMPIKHDSISNERETLEKKLVLAGASQTSIGRAMGYSRARAWQRIHEMGLYDTWKRASRKHHSL
ncbi:MAG TPA: hypothetical protein VK158_03880 [Acidobacteriota bacterium]|nr:hypothetical protein [Acidobacteriota bacterium]